MVVWIHESKRKIALQYTLLVALVVVTSSLGIGATFKELAVSAYQNLANVSSLSAAVPPTEINMLAQQFDQKQKELTEREKQLLIREQDLDEKYQESIAANRRLTIYVLSGVTMVLLLLIFLNFYFDVKREEEREKGILLQKSDTLSHTI